ncbi:class I SAM-dependent methyltransferase [Haladaptatus sp. F3-133]|uniref:Class I SAM-dependent methyltransferase n=1 Tax=Halorutilus salinus TaxID=2487751 RepID=A0A9Q4C5G7_9EURY|nr:class I SAM-dependent methyltransferase [Halorutilus salinus]MCX2819422.1 class I SAM-dependent methyltransferase [Halorutilus salinus]
MSFKRYLNAKASVERRSLDPTVLKEVEALIKGRTEPTVLEVGAGTGSMPIHLSEKDVLPEGTSYTALDKDGEVLDDARRRLSEHRLSETGSDGAVNIDGTEVGFVEGDLYDADGGYDLAVAHAVLDLLPVGEAVEHLLDLSEAFYFPVCFDGVTAFEPTYDEGFDRRIEEAYHATMDDRAGASRTGRRVFGAVRDSGGAVTAAASSDWVLFPGEDGYTEDERYMLRYIVETVGDAVEGAPEIDADRLQSWVEDRLRRIEDEELVYIAHQIDLAGRSN